MWIFKVSIKTDKAIFMKKIIGITGPSSFTEHVYSAVENALDACFVPLYQNKFDNLEYLLNNILDGVIFAGGVDIHPMSYVGRNREIGVRKGEGFSSFSLKRDISENFIYENCLKLNMPFMGICRGHQLILMNQDVYNFEMDLSDCTIAHSPKKHGVTLNPEEPCHIISLVNDSFLGKTKEIKWINSFHHQGFRLTHSFDNDAGKIRVLAVAGNSFRGVGVIEAAESKENNWFSVQWHPEIDWNTNQISLDCWLKFKEMING